MEEKSFKKLGQIITGLENAGPHKTVSRMLPEGEPPPQDWGGSARWALAQEQPIKTRVLIYIITGTFALLLFWMTVAPLDEIVSGTGKAIPQSGTMLVQAMDGGMVEEICVKESQIVQKGDLLLRIDPTRSNSNLGERHVQVMSLTAKISRLEALATGRPFTVRPEVERAVPTMVMHERNLYSTSLAELNSSVAVAREQLVQRQQELVEANARLYQLNSACALAADELSATKKLLESGAVSPLEVIRLEKEVAQANGDRNQARAQITRTKAAIQEASGQIRDIRLRFTNGWKNEFSNTLREKESLAEGNKAMADRVSQLEIRAPAKGTIKRLFVNTTGAVLMPGGSVAEIVANEDELVVEAQLSPNDRAFVRSGQSVVVKFTAYEYAVYGGLDGVVEYVGPDTVTDERGNTYYTIRVKTNAASFGTDKPVLPGMVAQVDIITGKRTILAYFMKPLMRAKEKALREH